MFQELNKKGCTLSKVLTKTFGVKRMACKWWVEWSCLLYMEWAINFSILLRWALLLFLALNFTLPPFLNTILKKNTIRDHHSLSWHTFFSKNIWCFRIRYPLYSYLTSSKIWKFTADVTGTQTVYYMIWDETTQTASSACISENSFSNFLGKTWHSHAGLRFYFISVKLT